jgi:hypothetical protein
VPNRRTQTHVTVDRDEIRRWADERGGEPAVVKGVRGPGPGIITLDFPGYAGGDKLRHVSWDEWFDKFEQSSLAFIYQEKTARGVRSNFNKLVSRESVDLKTGETKAAMPRRRRKQLERATAAKTARKPAQGARPPQGPATKKKERRKTARPSRSR